MGKFFNRYKHLFSKNEFVEDEEAGNNGEADYAAIEAGDDEEGYAEGAAEADELDYDEGEMRANEAGYGKSAAKSGEADYGVDEIKDGEVDHDEDADNKELEVGEADSEGIDNEELDSEEDDFDEDDELDSEEEESDEEDELDGGEYESDEEGELDGEEYESNDEGELDGEEDESDDEGELDSEEDEDDDDEIDDEEMEEESVGEASWEENRRAYRHKRRIRNQLIAYGVVALFMIVLVFAGITMGRKVSKLIKAAHGDDEQLTQQEEGQDKEDESEPEEILVETPPEIEESTLEEQLEEIVNNCISVMPLQDKVAGLFVITPEALTGVRTASEAGEGTQEALNNYAVGGLIYFSHNIQNREQLSQMLSNTVSMSKYPIFLAVDEEGGTVSRVANSSIEVVQVDDMRTIGEAGDTTAAYEAGITIGSYLNELGFNLDFAPVADVVTDTANSSLGKRAFGSEPSFCADMVANVVDGIQGTSVSACLKHFPGIGASKEDTHDGKVETSKTLEEMKNSDFIPFQAGIEAGVHLVMVSHITATAVDTDGLPSSLSKTMITEVLRGELGYEGVVITDALDMHAISDYYTSEEAAVGAIMAGADMLLMPEDFEAAYEGLLAAVQEGRISEERIDESLRRIYRIKYAEKLDMN